MDLSIETLGKNAQFMKNSDVYREFAGPAQAAFEEAQRERTLGNSQQKYSKYLTARFGLPESSIDAEIQQNMIQSVRNEVARLEGKPVTESLRSLQSPEFRKPQYAVTRLVLIDILQYLHPESLKPAIQAKQEGKQLSLPFPLCAIFKNCS